ncbi:2,3-bisphosphoglycerate-independent phosphoglycerate mutase [Astathelohania contejeani]|uniref:phosphoglycerate mutase (2,3-diphosphoglycerate-independent) n=1 Tax=Astathelohania contejeani TaxID=164912 RepID=A0ABQ7I1K9_9MICR|nr:2,3-bisphosphoglycerate-independent phosphoglycerate mutase [Thelohania contejeani]
MKKVCLVVIDGWGESKQTTGNAILSARTPWMDLLKTSNKTYYLHAHGEYVGLPSGQMGNSEVGHMTIGSGRVVPGELVRINKEIERGGMNISSFSDFLQKRVHFIGLLSDGGVHSHINHLKALIKLYKTKEIFVHCIADGRDTAPKCYLNYHDELQKFLDKEGVGNIASVSGRFYSMDRDKRMERTNKSYEMLTKGPATQKPIQEIISEAYKIIKTDEFIEPVLLKEEGVIKSGDMVIFFNFRADRMRQLVKKVSEIPDISVITLTDYGIKAMPIFTKQKIDATLSEVISRAGYNQAHIAETEKYAHVTYFFNGGKEDSLRGEHRIMVPSPQVRSYDQKPEMSVFLVVEEVFKKMGEGVEFIVCNLAPPDMVGHTGNFNATKEAILATDESIGLIYEACKEKNYVLIVTADHGNAEEMIGENGEIITKHTTNKVPFIICGDEGKPKEGEYSLQDVAPTILNIMGIPCPKEMTGSSLS